MRFRLWGTLLARCASRSHFQGFLFWWLVLVDRNVERCQKLAWSDHFGQVCRKLQQVYLWAAMGMAQKPMSNCTGVASGVHDLLLDCDFLTQRSQLWLKRITSNVMSPRFSPTNQFNVQTVPHNSMTAPPCLPHPRKNVTCRPITSEKFIVNYDCVSQSIFVPICPTFSGKLANHCQ